MFICLNKFWKPLTSLKLNNTFILNKYLWLYLKKNFYFKFQNIDGSTILHYLYSKKIVLQNKSNHVCSCSTVYVLIYLYFFIVELWPFYCVSNMVSNSRRYCESDLNSFCLICGEYMLKKNKEIRSLSSLRRLTFGTSKWNWATKTNIGSRISPVVPV